MVEWLQVTVNLQMVLNNQVQWFSGIKKRNLVVFMPSEGPEDLQRKLREAVEKLDTEEIYS